MTAPALAPRVTVIIPAYRAAPYIGAALASVFAQRHRAFEVIVINDGSPDTPELERVLAPWRARIRYLHQRNAGVSAARNAGILAAHTPLVAMLDADDAWEPEYLEVQIGALEADPTLDVVYPNAWIVGDHPHAGREYMRISPSSGPVTFDAIVTQRCHVFTGVLARRDALLRAGLYNPDLRAAEDFELWVRLVASGGRIGYRRRPLVRFRKHRGSLSSDPVWMTERAIEVYRKIAAMPGLTSDQRRLVLRRLAWFEAMLSLHRGKRAFFRRDIPDALAHLEDANAYFRSRKLALVGRLLRVSPSLLLHAYRWRDRLLVRANTEF